MKIVFLDQSSIVLDNDMDFSSIEVLGEFVSYPNSTKSEAIERAKDAETVIVNKVQMTREVISHLPQLKHIAVIATGYNNVDLKAAKEKGITVSNVSGYARYSVPQHAFALILNLVTRAYRYHNDIANGAWSRSPNFTLLTYPTFELRGKTLGIIGFGAIGKNVARIARAFDMKVLIHDVVEIDDPEYQNYSLDELLSHSDIITIHCPLTPQTSNLIDAKALKKMKNTAILINTARGGIVDEEALIDALKKREIAGAGFDVLSQEPPKPDHPLLQSIKNLILTPHSAWSTREARQTLINEVAENIKAFVEGRKRNIVNE